jgi:hypothetical protein
MGDTGFELHRFPAGKPHESKAGGSNSGNKGASFGDSPAGAPVPADPDLAAVTEAWPNLPPAVRAGIVAMVKASEAAR